MLTEEEEEDRWRGRAQSERGNVGGENLSQKEKMEERRGKLNRWDYKNGNAAGEEKKRRRRRRRR